MPGATKACQPTATAQPGQSSPSGDHPGTNPASIFHSPPCCGGSGLWVVAVGGIGVDGAVVGDTVVGAMGVSEGAGSVWVGGGVSLGGGLGLGAIAAAVKVEEGVAVGLGCGVKVGAGVCVGSRTATRVLVGVGVTAGPPGAHVVVSNPTRAVPARKNQSHRLFIAMVCSISPPDIGRGPSPSCPQIGVL